MDEHSDYQSYLLRLWRTHSGGATVWRASLQDPLTEEVLRFADVPSLVAFLCAQIGVGLESIKKSGGSSQPQPDSP